VLQTLVSVLIPSGGQLRARRNAWAAMSQDAQRLRAWREAEVAIARATARTTTAGTPAVSAPGIPARSASPGPMTAAR
jgi:hypothetical protein